MDFGDDTMGFDRNFELELGQSSVNKKSDKLMIFWKLEGKKVVGGIASSPMKYKNLVIFGCGDHYVYALDMNTGKDVWKFKASQIFVDMRPFESDGLVYVGSFDGNIYALDVETGEEVWRFKTGGKIYGSCVVENGKAYFGSADSFVYAVDARTGKEIWRFRTGAEVGSAPTIHKGVLYIGSYDQNLYALDPETGSELWRFRVGGNISNPLPYFIEDEIIYVGCIDGNVYAINLETRREIWRFRTGDWILGSPKPVHGLIYFTSSDGNIYCIDKEGGLVWKFMTESYMDGSTETLVVDDALYCGSSNENLYALDAKTGEELWRFRADGEIISSPVMHEDKLYFGTFGCHFHCIDLNGKEVWRFHTSSGVKWVPPPKSEWFEFEVDVKEQPGVELREYGKQVNVSEFQDLDSDYSMKSEYQFKSEYQGGSKYR